MLLVMLTQNTLVGVRDPFGIRPLVIGKIKDSSYVFTSETCASRYYWSKVCDEM